MRNSVAAAAQLPLVHTTRSYNLRAILDEGCINPQPCDVFTEESLTYFFVGRPAYKYKAENSTAEAWELPCCFVFESDAIGDIKRIFPFDSGAFAAGLYPSYINNLPLSEFEVQDPAGPSKLIGSFFASPDHYFNMRPKSRDAFEQEYSLGPFDAELIATSRLAAEATTTSFDDRRFTIEVQTESATQLIESGLIAVILPESYLAADGVLDKIQNDWKAEPIGYPIYPLSVSMYYATIYHQIHEFYKRRGYI